MILFKKSSQIRNEASLYLREISIVLNRVPRELLLLLKTNDLIRGLETALNTRDRDSAFIHMTKCCVRLINSYDRNQFKTDKKMLSLLKFNLLSFLREKFYLFKIYLFEMYLHFL